MKKYIFTFVCCIVSIFMIHIFIVYNNHESKIDNYACEKRVNVYHTDKHNTTDYLGNKIYSFCLR